MKKKTINSLIDDPDLVIGLAKTVKAERENTRRANETVQEQSNVISQQKGEIDKLTSTVQTLTDENQAMAKKASYLDTILSSKNALAIKQIAHDYGISGIKLNRILHDEHIQYNVNGQWILYREYADKGFVISETVQLEDKDGVPFSKMTTKWTQKGRAFIYQVLKKKGILPMIEKKDSFAYQNELPFN